MMRVANGGDLVWGLKALYRIGELLLRRMDGNSRHKKTWDNINAEVHCLLENLEGGNQS